MVRLGVHKLTKTSVAVKIVEKADLDEENLQKISREIEIMRRLNHPSIIRLYQVSGFLSTYVKNQGLAKKEALAVFMDTCIIAVQTQQRERNLWISSGIHFCVISNPILRIIKKCGKSGRFFLDLGNLLKIDTLQQFTIFFSK